MPDFEDRLRDRLADAARSAPPFRDALVTSAARQPRPWLRPLAAVAGLAVVCGVGVAWWKAARDDRPPEAASCAGRLTFGGATYAGQGPVVRMPRPGPVVGRARTVPCDDGGGAEPAEELTARALPGVPATDAFIAEGAIWLNTGLAQEPDAVRALEQPVACTGSQPLSVTGRLEGVDAEPLGKDFAFRPPYAADLVVTAGSGLLLDHYESVRLTVTVTSSTVNGDDRRLLRSALTDGAAISAELRCSGSSFVASAISAAP